MAWNFLPKALFTFFQVEVFSNTWYLIPKMKIFEELCINNTSMENLDELVFELFEISYSLMFLLNYFFEQ